MALILKKKLKPAVKQVYESPTGQVFDGISMAKDMTMICLEGGIDALPSHNKQEGDSTDAVENILSTANNTSQQEAALCYVEHFKWSVFPLHWIDDNGCCSCNDNECKSQGKHPLVKWGNEATTDHDQITQWWSKWPKANIGIATGAKSGLVVLDVDVDSGGEASLNKLLDQYGPLPETIRVKTGSGGEHIYFKHPGGKVGNSASKVGAGLDIRGDGGYVVAPPSNHLKGNYQWK
ncbi:MAG: bifunctional DNA primase/polymerase [Nitrospirae bacterium]|nr:bifunctional DNA primase/polymerase [Magnetococcales bacterium]HAT50435.1 hypothetical protein [Alphaproteobacteria bacterium]